jgi:hypothetical protein
VVVAAAVLAVHKLVKLAVLAAVAFLMHKLEALGTRHQQAHHKVARVARAVVLATNMVLVAVAGHLLLALMAQLRAAAMVGPVLHQAFPVQALPMLVAAAAARFLARHLHLAALAGAVEAQQTLMERLAQQTLAVAAAAQTLPMTAYRTMAALAAQASSSSPIQAQPNNLAVELLPNQAVTSFTHSHLLAHLALCHL